MEDNLTFVGVDQAQVKTGLCSLRSFPGGLEGSQDSTSILHVRSRGPARIIEYRDRLTAYLESLGNVTLAALESGAYDGGGRVFQLGGVSAVTQLVFCDLGISFLEPTPQHLKSFLTGRSDAPKEWMVMEVKNRIGKDVTTDEADAYALAAIARAFFTEEVRTRKEARVLLNLRKQGRFHER